jgi:uncharacterized membrane protein YkvA (DUF1232 family)
MTWFSKLKTETKKLKLKAQALLFAYADKRTPLIAKILIWITLAYLLSPVDLIPDFIPVIGLLDDLLIVPILITLSIKQIPKEVWLEAIAKAEANPQPPKRTNWIVGVIIILAWSAMLYYLLQFLFILA